MSLPAPPSITSEPESTINLSDPAPPSSLSFPGPPESVSDPRSPNITSSPSPPAIVSLPALPKIVSFPASPLMMLLEESPTKLPSELASVKSLYLLKRLRSKVSSSCSLNCSNCLLMSFMNQDWLIISASAVVKKLKSKLISSAIDLKSMSLMDD